MIQRILVVSSAFCHLCHVPFSPSENFLQEHLIEQRENGLLGQCHAYYCLARLIF